MNKSTFILLLMTGWITEACAPDSGVLFRPPAENALRAPAYPLLTIDPYTSAWSFADRLNDDVVRHWTGKTYPLTGVLRVDGLAYRFMGREEMPLKILLPPVAMENRGTVYTDHTPPSGWAETGFDDTSWKREPVPATAADTHHRSPSTTRSDTWIRRTFETDGDCSADTFFLEYSHNGRFELFLNGQSMAGATGSGSSPVIEKLPGETGALIRRGKNVAAVHLQHAGGGSTDFGIYRKERQAGLFARRAVQETVVVSATQTYYTFVCGPVRLKLVFTSPLLPDDPERLSTPVNYLSYEVSAADGAPHHVQLYLEATPQWAVHADEQAVSVAREEKNGLVYLKTGTVEQPVLQRSGDQTRIDWGYFYLAAAGAPSVALASGEYSAVRQAFVTAGKLPSGEPTGILSFQMLREMNVLAYCHDLGAVKKPASGYLMIGYDDLYSVRYFHDNRMPYWKHGGKVSVYQAFEQAASGYASVMERCRRFDSRLARDAEKAGGPEYAALCALAYRQAVSAHKLTTDRQGNRLFLSKANSDSGYAAAVDITYFSAPLFLLYNPALLEGMLAPVFYYSESGLWNKPFPAHDIGAYPLASGQVCDADMPVETCGSMLLLTTALTLRTGCPDFARKHAETLAGWAAWLLREGFDPAAQSCADDLDGRTAHNANLSIKAILGIAAYGKLAALTGDSAAAEKYGAAARRMGREWMEKAGSGDHYLLAFDRPGSWSQKYNLVWDRLLDLRVFPAEVAEKEIAYYLERQQMYGLPLDSRHTCTRSDRLFWTACLAQHADDFRALTAPVYRYAAETPVRIPLSDWHETTDGKPIGFRARPVVGAYFMKMLQEEMGRKHVPRE